MVKSVRLLQPAARLGPYPSRRRTNGPIPSRRPVLIALCLILIAAGLSFGWYLRIRERSQYLVHPAPVNTVIAKGTPMAPRTVDITANTAAITWTTEAALSSQVEYGSTSDYGLLSVFNASPATVHKVVLTGLTPGATYHYAVLSADEQGQVVRSDDMTFATSLAAGTPVLSLPKAIDITATTATVVWTSDKPSASQVEYGTTPAYGILSVFNSSMVSSHSVILTGLTPGSTYDAIAMSTDANGEVGRSANFSFTVSGNSGAPVISLVGVGRITTNSATVSWTTDQPSATQIAYGISTNYGSLSAFNPSLVTTHSMILTSLTPGTTYNLSALSSNPAGQVGSSANLAFTTVAGPPVIRQVKAIDLTESSATIVWTTDQPASTRVAYGTSASYGSMSATKSSLVTAHSVTLRGLKPGTRYNAAAVSANAAGMQNSSPTLVFSTPRN